MRILRDDLCDSEKETVIAFLLLQAEQPLGRLQDFEDVRGRQELEEGSSEQMQGMLATIPAGYAGTAEDCVGAYLFLASPALSGYVTGQVIEVNGGQLMP